MKPLPLIIRAAATAILALAVFAAFASAGPCDPQCSSIPDAVAMSPDGSLEYKVVIECCGTGPVSGALVEIEFAQEVDELLAWAIGQTHPVISGFTDASGEVTFHIAASGCIDLTRFNPAAYIVQVRADGIVLAEPSTVNSPDAVDAGGRLPSGYGANLCEGGMTSTTLADAVFHTPSITNARIEPCTRFSGDPSTHVTLEDAVIVTRFIKLGISATCQ